MIHGLKINWKQVVAYYVTSDSVEGKVLWNLIKQCILDLNAIQVNARTVVCDI